MSNTPAPMSPFDSIRHADDSGEYWSARELAVLLEYTEWRNFEKVVKKAIKACQNSQQQVSDHFVDINKMVDIGSGTQRSIRDYHLSRYACYLVVQNADPEKEIVALGQTYFTIRTRRDELATERQSIEELRARITERERLRKRHKDLYAAAASAGITDPLEFATFENHGYRGLYDGETREDIAERKGLPLTANISDYMDALEEGANSFRALMATEMIRRDGTQGTTAANQTHYIAGSAVRKAMKDAGVPMPEKLPNTPHIREARRALKRQEQIEAEDRLGLWAQLEAGEDEPDDTNE